MQHKFEAQQYVHSSKHVVAFASERQVKRGFQDGSRRREGIAREARQERFMSLRFRPEISRNAA